jgi:hypothetical protein
LRVRRWCGRHGCVLRRAQKSVQDSLQDYALAGVKKFGGLQSCHVYGCGWSGGRGL